MSAKSPDILVHCLNCGKAFNTKQWRLDAGRGRFCGHPCRTQFYHTGKPKPKSRENIKAANEARRSSGYAAWNKAPVTMTCEICGNSFDVPKSIVSKRRHCSNACKAEFQRRSGGPSNPRWKRVERQCEWCGKTVWVKQAKLHEFRFCSRHCMGSYNCAQAALKQGPTSIELALRNEMNRCGLLYQEQYRIAHWLVDFAMPQYRLAIECDGDYWHSLPDRKVKDANKDRWLQAHKWTILRFTETAIKASAPDCVDAILDAIRRAPSPKYGRSRNRRSKP